MKRLQNSGYDATYRLDTLKSGLNGFKKQQEADERGETQMYRPKGYKKMERLLEKKVNYDTSHPKLSAKENDRIKTESFEIE